MKMVRVGRVGERGVKCDSQMGWCLVVRWVVAIALTPPPPPPPPPLVPLESRSRSRHRRQVPRRRSPASRTRTPKRSRSGPRGGAPEITRENEDDMDLEDDDEPMGGSVMSGVSETLTSNTEVDR